VAAAKVWRDEIPAAAAKASDAAAVVTALRNDVDAAKTRFGKAVGVGAAYFFVQGRGRVTARERNQLTVALDGAPGEVIALRIGPVFGNTIRDGCGRLDLNAFPGLTEFNALSAELNALAEQTVLPALRQRAQVGSKVTFAGCAEAPDYAADPGEPMLTIVPVSAEVQ
jgi:predicted lipoprotein